MTAALILFLIFIISLMVGYIGHQHERYLRLRRKYANLDREFRQIGSSLIEMEQRLQPWN